MNRSRNSSLFLGILIATLVVQLYPISIEVRANPNVQEGISLAAAPSHYVVNQSVYYDVEVDFTLTHLSSISQPYYFKVSRLVSRTPDTIDGVPPYQEVELRQNSIQGPSSLEEISDDFNNVFDQFSATLNQNNIISLTQRYRVKLSEIYFEGIVDADIGTYDTSHSMFELYCNRNETFYERANANLIALSNGLVSTGDNPIEKAQKIYNWIVANLDYIEVIPEMGALWAFNNGGGDCSDYSDLMITLLRIQGIPARKVGGYIYSNNPALTPKVDDMISFQGSWDGNSYTDAGIFMGHAWVEYFVPNIGWIAVDPLWGEGGGSFYYFNRIDFLHFNCDVGAWFDYPPDLQESEFPLLTSPVTYDHSLYSAEWSLRITVVDPMNEVIIVVVVISIIIGSIVALAAVIMHRKNISIRDIHLKKLNLRSIEIPSLKAGIDATTYSWYMRKTRRQKKKFNKLSGSIHDPDKRSKLEKFTNSSKEILKGIKLDMQIKRQNKQFDKKLEKLGSKRD